MQVTREHLEKRLMGLRDQHSRLQADLYAVEGAMQVVEQLKLQLDEPEATEAEIVG
jgi:hypothetical protein